ncbi:MAG: XRE family transcriptional regulator [Deltaproteobacteria bacterium]|nr:XRE family transcriptional regulator [Deltaproteobacteria bacterium]MBI2341625.1 XRE family transcriptional regulator [Deltaproteobacteria bacterium]MBI2974269.1 XRE family transcriptional regulator [Deltaproteobacteria bacterium]
MDLRERIKTIISNKSLSIRQLSLKSGVRRQSIIRFFEGGNIHIANLNKILNALGYDLNFSKVASSNDAPAFLQARLKYSKKSLLNFCKEKGIKYLAVFGSVLREDFSKNSDIDLLVEFNRPIDFFEFASIEDGLQEIFKTGHKLDVVTIKSVSPLLVEDMAKNSEVLYEEAA